jgi:hypothetical protein
VVEILASFEGDDLSFGFKKRSILIELKKVFFKRTLQNESCWFIQTLTKYIFQGFNRRRTRGIKAILIWSLDFNVHTMNANKA